MNNEKRQLSINKIIDRL